MPTLRSINNMQLKIQRTGTLQIFFPLFCFLKRTYTCNKRYLRFHIAITVTGVPFVRGINAFLLKAQHTIEPRVWWGGFPLPYGTEGVSKASTMLSKGQISSLKYFFSTEIWSFRNGQCQDLIVGGYLNNSTLLDAAFTKTQRAALPLSWKF